MLYLSLLLSDLCIANIESLFEKDSIRIVGLFGLSFKLFGLKKLIPDNPPKNSVPSLAWV